MEGGAAIEDHLLIRRIQQGDKEAFESLVVKYYPDVFAYCLRRCGAGAAADLTQDVFLRLVHSVQGYRFTGKFKNFIFTIAVNLCNDYAKKLPPAEVNIDGLSLANSDPGPMESTLDREREAMIKDILDRLPATQKEALILFYYHDMRIIDIARVTGVGLSTVKSRLKQGRGKIKDMLREEGYFERDF